MSKDDNIKRMKQFVLFQLAGILTMAVITSQFNLPSEIFWIYVSLTLIFQGIWSMKTKIFLSVNRRAPSAASVIDITESEEAVIAGFLLTLSGGISLILNILKLI